MKVVIVGGGLVGSLAAVFFAKRGWSVEVYEKRAGTAEFCKVIIRLMITR